MSETSSKSEIIENPLQWQKEMDAVNVGINMKGSSRFWDTVESMLDGRWIIHDGAPEFTSLDMHLKDDVWLRLSGNEAGWIEYCFVSQEQVEQDHSWIEWDEWHNAESEGE